jgi:hypothetical protein
MYLISFALPAKIVMVSNGRYTGFSHKLCNGHAKGQVQGNGQGILRNQDINAKWILILSDGFPKGKLPGFFGCEKVGIVVA